LKIQNLINSASHYARLTVVDQAGYSSPFDCVLFLADYIIKSNCSFFVLLCSQTCTHVSDTPCKNNLLPHRLLFSHWCLEEFGLSWWTV